MRIFAHFHPRAEHEAKELPKPPIIWAQPRNSQRNSPKGRICQITPEYGPSKSKEFPNTEPNPLPIPNPSEPFRTLPNHSEPNRTHSSAFIFVRVKVFIENFEFWREISKWCPKFLEKFRNRWSLEWFIYVRYQGKVVFYLKFFNRLKWKIFNWNWNFKEHRRQKKRSTKFLKSPATKQKFILTMEWWEKFEEFEKFPKFSKYFYSKTKSTCFLYNNIVISI